MLKRIALFCLCLFLAFPAHAEEEKYIEATVADLLHTLLKFNALNVMEDNNLLDEYAAITDCELYEYYYKDDFKWNQIRTLVRKSITDKLATFPSHFQFNAKFRMDRYDFTDELYRFSKRNPINAVNVITLLDHSGPVCGNLYISYLPPNYKAKLDPPVTVPGLHIDPQAAEAMLNFMDANGNMDHTVYARFNLTIFYIEPLRRTANNPGVRNREYAYYQTGNQHHSMILDARVDSIQFYENPEMTKLVYTFKPSSL